MTVHKVSWTHLGIYTPIADILHGSCSINEWTLWLCKKSCELLFRELRGIMLRISMGFYDFRECWYKARVNLPLYIMFGDVVERDFFGGMCKIVRKGSLNPVLSMTQNDELKRNVSYAVKNSLDQHFYPSCRALINSIYYDNPVALDFAFSGKLDGLYDKGTEFLRQRVQISHCRSTHENFAYCQNEFGFRWAGMLAIIGMMWPASINDEKEQKKVAPIICKEGLPVEQ